MQKINIYFFGSNRSFVSSLFLNSLFKFTSNNPSFNVKCIVNTDTYFDLDQNSWVYKIKNRIKFFLFFLFNRKFYKFEKDADKEYNKFLNIRAQAKKNNTQYVQFSNFKKKIIKKNSLLLNVGGEQIFLQSFLYKFFLAINYHNAELPKYRGANSNRFSVFYNKKNTYFSFHYINSKIDKGFVFYKHKVKIRKNIKYHLFYEIIKAQIASKNIKKILLNALRNKKNKFKPLRGGNYYPLKYYENFFYNINKFTFKEIKNYIDVFGGIYYKGNFVTDIKKNDKGIKLKDCYISITKMKFFPIFLYKILIVFSIINK